MRNLQLPGRSPVRAMNGMVATSHPLATSVALAALQSGGNAMDAAITAAAVQAVVEPQSTGIGGDCFALYCPAGSSNVIAFNGSGRAPAAASVEWYRDHGFSEIPLLGVHAVTVPGAIDAWCRLLDAHGRKGIDAALAPAIRYAEEGYVIHDRVAFDWAAAKETLQLDAPTSHIFLKGGEPLRSGDVHRQSELARTLRMISTRGRSGFYEGEVAEDIVAHLRHLGGLHTLDDFAATKGNFVKPVATEYRDYRLHQMPPNNQGLTALLIANILQGFDLARLDPASPQRFHLFLEAARLAYRERDRHIADQDHMKVSVEALLAPHYADQLCRMINPDRAMSSLPEPVLSRGDTVYISVVDGDGNAASFINSIYHSFGSGITSPATGVLLQNRGASFRLDPAHPNCIAPAKRPMHTIMPAMLTKNGHAVMPFGVMGGDFQPFGQALVLSNILDHGMDLQEAIDFPRVFFEAGAVVAEAGICDETCKGLAALGHRVARTEEPLGGGQAIWIDRDRGTLTGASDPRKDGCALGY